jgi:2-dehydro-3-deoxyphosphogluconate aldolase/(4S)-4-hydroxy-2-oxoglutarate aldolase
MHEVIKKIGEIGIVPVVKIEKASDAAALGKALIDGDLPLAEITFRTAAAADAIAVLCKEFPQMLVGAGTVLTIEQAKQAVGAGARFIVAPGFNPKIVDHCISHGVPVTPGICSPTEIEMALERGLEVLKFFPAGASGGLDFLKAIAAPYAGVKFIPTGGVDPHNLKEYLSFNRVHAVGGTWIAKDTMISAGKFDEIAKLAREAVLASHGFELAHVGINETGPDKAMAGAETLNRLFSFPIKDGTGSVFAGTGVEVLKSKYLGSHGHLAISTINIHRAAAYLEGKGARMKPETAKEKDGKLVAVYLDVEVGGFAVHLLQK